MSDFFNELVNKSKIHPVFSVIKTDTGYRVMEATDFVGAAAITYGTFITGLTSGATSIPVGAKQWAIAVESGSAFVNGVQFNAGISLDGGSVSASLSTGIPIGCTGGRVLIYYTI